MNTTENVARSKYNDFYELRSEASHIIIDTSQGIPKLLYWGAPLNNNTKVSELRLISRRMEAPAAPKNEIPLSLCPSLGMGYHGAPGIVIDGANNAWAFAARIDAVEQNTKSQIVIHTSDAIRKVMLSHYLTLDPFSNVLQTHTTITNQNSHTIRLQWCAALCFLLPAICNRFTTFSGQWAGEFHLTTQVINSGSYCLENRRGRTSHDCFPGILIHTDTTSEHSGQCYGFHLAWSGNHKTQLDMLSDGRIGLQMGELLLPGEIILNQNDSYQSPTLLGSFSDRGFSGFSNHMHNYAKTLVKPEPRKPVVFNTWEALYFDQNTQSLKVLIDMAAELGVERFVIDDGWFLGRRNDRIGLGDWYVDRSIYPDDLTPLIDQIKAHSMEFGLWLEPEMVNKNSDLYRQHPDWILCTHGNEPVCFRNQWVLDISRQEVYDYLLERIDSLLQQYAIDFIKWDLNRDLNQAGDSISGQACVHRHVTAVYRLMHTIKVRFPEVEIESCASGGGRLDYGILPLVQRFWISDATDAYERAIIQKGYSMFFPLSLMGSHVGPSPSPITQRQLSMHFRAGVALFGQMGLELDLRQLDEEDKMILKAAIGIHKEFRELFHGGRLLRISTNNEALCFAVFANDNKRAVYAYIQLQSSKQSIPGRLLFTGLSNDKHYFCKVIWPLEFHQLHQSAFEGLGDQTISGQLLSQVGIQLPKLQPETITVFHVCQQ